MKQHDNTLRNEVYAYALIALSKLFRQNEREMILVGGCATQAYLLDMLGDQAELRLTDDIDFLIKTEKKTDDVMKKIYAVLNTGIGEVYGKGYLEMRMVRESESRPILSVDYLDQKNEQIEHMKLRLNLYTDESEATDLDKRCHDVRIDNATEIKLRLIDEVLEVKAISVEHLIATKMVGAREKDMKDVESLLDAMLRSGRELSFDKLKQICPLITDQEKRIELKKKYFEFVRKRDARSAQKHPAKCSMAMRCQ